MESLVDKPLFTEIDHSYYNHVRNKRYISVTTKIHTLEKEQDWVKIAQQYLDNKGSFDNVVEDLMTKQRKSRDEILVMINNRPLDADTIRDIWKIYSLERCAVGTKEHLRRETLDKSTDYFITKMGSKIPIGIDATYVENLYDLPDGRYCELLIWDEESGISGQSDIVDIETIEGVRYVTVSDYKTNQKLVDYNYIDKRTGKPVINNLMLAPFGNLCNCNYWHYQIQLNMYGYMLRKFGFTFMGGDIIHTEDGDKRYPLLDLQNQVHRAFEMWKI